jgi:hypothetical protein
MAKMDKVEAGLLAALVVLLVIIAVVAVVRARKPHGNKGRYVTSAPSSEMDGLMQRTMVLGARAAKDSNAYYPIMLVTHKGADLELKVSRNSDTMRFETFGGLGSLWDWSKGVCHLVVWARALPELSELRPDTDIVQIATEQHKNIVGTLANLPSVMTEFDGLRGKVTTPGFPPVTIDATSEQLTSNATVILNGAKAFAENIIKTGAVTQAHVVSFIAKVGGEVSWLMYVAGNVVNERLFKQLLMWKQKLGNAQWDHLGVIIQTSVASDTVTSYTPRGDCKSGDSFMLLMGRLMTPENISMRISLYSGADLTFAIASTLLHKQHVAIGVAEKLGDSEHSKSLRSDIIQPSNALTYAFTKKKVEEIVQACQKTHGSGCPFSAESSWPIDVETVARKVAADPEGASGKHSS